MLAGHALTLVQEQDERGVLLPVLLVLFKQLLERQLLLLVIHYDNDVGLEGLDGVDDALVFLFLLGTKRIDEDARGKHPWVHWVDVGGVGCLVSLSVCACTSVVELVVRLELDNVMLHFHFASLSELSDLSIVIVWCDIDRWLSSSLEVVDCFGCQVICTTVNYVFNQGS